MYMAYTKSHVRVAPKKKSAWENGRSEHAPDPSRSKKAVIPFSQVETLNTEGTDSRDNECGEIEMRLQLAPVRAAETK